MTPGAGYVDPSSNTYTFVSFSNTSAQHDALVTALVPLFTTPGFSAVPDLGAIADAIHTATTGLQAAVTIVNASGASSPGTIGIE